MHRGPTRQPLVLILLMLGACRTSDDPITPTGVFDPVAQPEPDPYPDDAHANRSGDPDEVATFYDDLPEGHPYKAMKDSVLAILTNDSSALTRFRDVVRVNRPPRPDRPIKVAITEYGFLAPRVTEWRVQQCLRTTFDTRDPARHNCHPKLRDWVEADVTFEDGVMSFLPPAADPALAGACAMVARRYHHFLMEPDCTPEVNFVGLGFDDRGEQVAAFRGTHQLNLGEVSLTDHPPLQTVWPEVRVRPSPFVDERILELTWTPPADEDPEVSQATDAHVWSWFHPSEGSMTAGTHGFSKELDGGRLHMQIGWAIADDDRASRLTVSLSMARDVAMNWWFDNGLYVFDVVQQDDGTFAVYPVDLPGPLP